MGQTVTELYDETAVKEKYGVTPAEFVDLKALMGDKSDNIPGVSGIGEKTASKLISEYKDIENMYEHIEDLPVTARIKEKLKNEKDNAFLSKTLAKIDTNVPIDIDIIKGEFPNDFTGTDPELYGALLNLGLKSTIKRMNLSAQNSSAASEQADFFENKKFVGYVAEENN